MYTFHFHKIASNTTIISIPSPLWAYKSLQIYINLMCRFTFNCSMMLQEKTFSLIPDAFNEICKILGLQIHQNTQLLIWD